VIIPLRYAALSTRRQRWVAQRIVDLRLFRDELRPVEDRAEELEKLEAPFAETHIYRPAGGEEFGYFDQDGAHFDEAAFLRRFPGEPALAGDLLLAQVEVQMASELFTAVLDLTPAELRRATDWWGSLVAADNIGPAFRRAAAFYESTAVALKDLLESDPELREQRALPMLAELCRMRAALFAESGERGERVFEWQPSFLVTRIGRVPVPARLVQAVGVPAGLVRLVAEAWLGRRGGQRW
jgi:hypothetical protein